MMPMRIRRKGCPIEKLENPTALQRRGRSGSCDAANQITLASTCTTHRLQRQLIVSFVALARRKIAPRTSLAGYEGFARQSCGKLRETEPRNAPNP
jgi:hypothetical protein